MKYDQEVLSLIDQFFSKEQLSKLDKTTLINACLLTIGNFNYVVSVLEDLSSSRHLLTTNLLDERDRLKMLLDIKNKEIFHLRKTVRDLEKYKQFEEAIKKYQSKSGEDVKH